MSEDRFVLVDFEEEDPYLECELCGQAIRRDHLNRRQTQLWIETGLCPDCQAAAGIHRPNQNYWRPQ